MAPSPSSRAPFSIATLALEKGARIGLCRMPGRTGDLSGDVAVLAQWNPRLVVSMTELVEMQVCALEAALAKRGIGWVHFPIRDFGAPETSDKRWSPLATHLHHALNAGEGVLLHCMGGLGRSGMIAMRLMVERGAKPAEALTALRAARPGAVETKAQESWAAMERVPPTD